MSDSPVSASLISTSLISTLSRALTPPVREVYAVLVRVGILRIVD
ncbi:hypothetical protein [Rhodococcus sp. (in: high G+C Gram-positive bacteria)]|nr:hypothetical protein [Rhodococcus sp. (in: high G+C Gram-positive bacteria)]